MFEEGGVEVSGGGAEVAFGRGWRRNGEALCASPDACRIDR